VNLSNQSAKGLNMRRQTGLTRVDLVVALACVALVLAQAAVLNAGGRQRSKKEVCLANLRALASAWQTYSNDNSGKIPVGDIYYSWAFPGVTGSSTGPQLAWREWPHPFPHSMPPSYATNCSAAYSYSASITQAAWEHAIAEGTLWKYVGDHNIYRCPSAGKDQYVTYNMSMSMNAYPGVSGIGAVTFTNINQIIKPAERFVFLDAGVVKQGAFYVVYSTGGGSQPGKWYDLPPVIHSQGTTFVFADGHTEYRRWTDPHALSSINAGWGNGTIDYCDCDLRWMTQITWGDVPYTCANPAKNCEY
jgi:prepilin-type processing-associated H-X9-DG protein